MSRKSEIAHSLQSSARRHPEPKGSFGELEKKTGSKKLAGWITQNLEKGSKTRAGKGK